MIKKLLSIFSIVLLLASQAYGITSKNWTLVGSTVTFSDTGGTVTMVFSAIATANGKVSAQFDKDSLKDATTGAMPSLWSGYCQLSFGTGPTMGVVGAEYFIVHADSTGAVTSGGVGTVSAGITTDQRRALQLIGVLPVYNTAANTTMTVFFNNIYIPGRYFSLAWWNASGQTTESSSTKHKCVMTPMTNQMQGS